MKLKNCKLDGEFYTDDAIKKIYATDASAYREIPLAVALPKNDDDVKKLIQYAKDHHTSLIPRTAGTSLAGQVVGGGIVVDFSKYFTNIISIDENNQWAWVQPGIIRDDLNKMLAKRGVFFAPETSTSNRAMIGGMIGNNSCGANSVVYGSTREHLLEVKALLANGEAVHFAPQESLEENENVSLKKFSSQIHQLLSDPTIKHLIETEYPNPTIPRRNTGYALDLLLRMKPFHAQGSPFNFCSLLAGSEGTLAMVLAAKIKLTPLPPPNAQLLCIHCNSIYESLQANLVALSFQPYASELMDHYILDATARIEEYKENRFFIEGNPKAILAVELRHSDPKLLTSQSQELLAALKSQNLGYHYACVKNEKIAQVWSLRKAGLGALSNVPGDTKAAPVIEDTAVRVEDLPQYIEDFNEILKKHGLYSVHYAHAGSGELHLRPLLNLKTEEGKKLFRLIAEEIAHLVKKYKGSLSGEHGDGRLRGEFIPQMMGNTLYEIFQKIKATWDPQNIFNPGKIVNTPPMDSHLRYATENRDFDTLLDFSDDLGLLRSVEKCNGSGDCRKSPLSGGTMCPSYMATQNEKDTTRARANILREYLTYSPKNNPFEHKEIKEIMDLCISCKGCKKECPSTVDMTKIKAEWQYQYNQTHGVPLRTRVLSHFHRAMKAFEYTPWLYNLTRNLPKTVLGFAPQRSLPKMAPTTLWNWFHKQFTPTVVRPKGKIYFFFDEFTNYLDVEIGKKALLLFDRWGYQILPIAHAASGRAYLSKGMLKNAQKLAHTNTTLFYNQLQKTPAPIVGLEPSAILTFRDEYVSLAKGKMKEKATFVSHFAFTFEEWLAKELQTEKLNSADLQTQPLDVAVHIHCHQKALHSTAIFQKIFDSAPNIQAKILNTGCCGMAGSFGYEKEHYDISMKIGNLVLFPAVEKYTQNTKIIASGTSCRHQIWDGTKRKAHHLVEIF